jgi:glutamyl-tRNA synthetase
MALFDYAFAKQQGGTFILRVEDTDRKRYNPESEARVLDALSWLGLEPDESPTTGGPNAPYRQTERLEIYQRHVQRLLGEGKAYRAFETPDELEAIRHDLQRRGLGHGYDGRGRQLSREESERRAASGEPFVVRLITPDEGETVVKDLLRGDIHIPNREVPDAVLLKSDGLPTYHLAVVVDDHLMGVSHAVRGEEWIPTAPIHVLLYRAFGWEEPQWVHMPLLKNAEGKKLSKRKDDVNLDAYRRQGVLPEALLNYLGTMGWSMPDGREFFSLGDMIRHFSFERVSLGGSIFDPKRLKHYNAKYLRDLPLEDLAERVKPFLAEAGVLPQDERYLLDVLDITRKRVETLAEFPKAVAYFFSDDFPFEAEAKKRLAAGQKYLEDLEREFARLEDYDEDSIDDMLHDYVQAQSVGMGKVLQPLRVALTGTMQAPGITELVSALGRDRVLTRLGRALAYITAGLPDDRPVRPEEAKVASRAGARE